jgi:hypothetical protein
MISECPNTDQDLVAVLWSFIVSDNERYTASGKEEKQNETYWLVWRLFQP